LDGKIPADNGRGGGGGEEVGGWGLAERSWEEREKTLRSRPEGDRREEEELEPAVRELEPAERELEPAARELEPAVRKELALVRPAPPSAAAFTVVAGEEPPVSVVPLFSARLAAVVVAWFSSKLRPRKLQLPLLPLLLLLSLLARKLMARGSFCVGPDVAAAGAAAAAPAVVVVIVVAAVTSAAAAVEITGGVKAWKEARLEGVIIITPNVLLLAAAVAVAALWLG
jgi:hypothetical protein